MTNNETIQQLIMHIKNNYQDKKDPNNNESMSAWIEIDALGNLIIEDMNSQKQFEFNPNTI